MCEMPSVNKDAINVQGCFDLAPGRSQDKTGWQLRSLGWDLHSPELAVQWKNDILVESI